VTWRVAEECPLDAGGFRGWYADVGAGPPVVVLASPMARAKTYRPTARSLADRFRVVTVEMPGSGRASRLPRPWSLDEYAAWALAALDALQLTDATVLGHSHSGALPVLMAARSTTRVGRIGIVDSIGAGGPHHFVRTLWGRAFDACLEPDLVLARAHHVLGTGLRHPRNMVAQTWVSLRADVTAACRRVAVPALVAWGARDHILPPRCAAAYARHLPRPSLYLSPRGAHEWMIYHPHEFAEVLGGFIRSTR